MWRWCRFIGDFAVRKSDSPEQGEMKRQLLPVVVFSLVLEGLIIVRNHDLAVSLYEVGTYVLVLGSVTFAVVMPTNLVKVGPALDVLLILATIGILLCDFDLASDLANRPWGIVILYLDAALVYERRFIQRFILPTVVLYLTFER
eukprot:Hpha_TRINITY_DN24390_c0_g1::TRINITY_DN24390_c0_g1_i1::g.147995::m.147995